MAPKVIEVLRVKMWSMPEVAEAHNENQIRPAKMGFQAACGGGKRKGRRERGGRDKKCKSELCGE
jgi:hypothetical protein